MEDNFMTPYKIVSQDKMNESVENQISLVSEKILKSQIFKFNTKIKILEDKLNKSDNKRQILVFYFSKFIFNSSIF